jgi:N-acetylglucosamine-6-phosphate deacetylase
MAGVPIERAADGAAHTRDGRLARSTLTLDAAARNWQTMTRATLAEALSAASQAPAAATRLHADAPAYLVHLDSAGMIQWVMRRGRWRDQ